MHGSVKKKEFFFNKLNVHVAARLLHCALVRHMKVYIHIWLYYKNYSVKKARVVILVSGHWPTFYISVVHAVMMVEGLTPLPYPVPCSCSKFMYMFYFCSCIAGYHEDYKYCTLKQHIY